MSRLVLKENFPELKASLSTWVSMRRGSMPNKRHKCTFLITGMKCELTSVYQTEWDLYNFRRWSSNGIKKTGKEIMPIMNLHNVRG